MGRKTKRRGNEPVNERQSGDPRDPASWGPSDRTAEPSPLFNMAAQGGVDKMQIDAATEIKMAYYGIVEGKQLLKAACLDDAPRGDGTFRDPSTAAITREQHYKLWANEMKKYNLRYNGRRPVLPVILDVIWEERPLDMVAFDHGFDHRKIARLVRYGLDEYIYIAGWRRRQAA